MCFANFWKSLIVVTMRLNAWCFPSWLKMVLCVLNSRWSIGFATSKSLNAQTWFQMSASSIKIENTLSQSNIIFLAYRILNCQGNWPQNSRGYIVYSIFMMRNKIWIWNFQMEMKHIIRKFCGDSDILIIKQYDFLYIIHCTNTIIFHTFT